MPITNKDFYLSAYKKYGRSARGLNWNSIDSQKARFQVLTDMLGEKEIQSSVIADAGCGFGDLYVFWFVSRCLPKKYIGLEVLSEFCKVAIASLPQSHTCKVLQRDILQDNLPKAHWYVASGSLNILSDFDTWLFLEKMLASSTRGIVFNILEGDKQSDVYNYKTLKEIEDFAQKRALHVQVQKGYLANDMTVRLQKLDKQYNY